MAKKCYAECRYAECSYTGRRCANIFHLQHISGHVRHASPLAVMPDGEVLLVLLGADEPAVAVGQVKAVLGPML
jgi:hypothetical protein